MRFVLVEFPHDQDTSVLTQFLISRVLRFQRAASFKALAPFAKGCVKREKKQIWEQQQQEKKKNEDKKKKADVTASEAQVISNEEHPPTEDDQEKEIKDELTLDFCGERRTFVFKNNIPIRVYDLVTEHGGNEGEGGEQPPLTEKEMKVEAGGESTETGQPTGSGNEALKQKEKGKTAGEGAEYEQPIDTVVKEELQNEENGGGGGIPQGIRLERDQTTMQVKQEPEDEVPEEPTTPPAVSSDDQPVVTKENPLMGQMEMDEAPVVQEDVEVEAEEVTEREEPAVHQPVSKRMRMGSEDNLTFPAHIDANEVDFLPNQVDLPLLDEEDGLDGGLADFGPPSGDIHSNDREDQDDGRDLDDCMGEVPVEDENMRRKISRVSNHSKFYGEFHQDKESDGEESSEESGGDSSGSEDEWEEQTRRKCVSSNGDEEEQREKDVNQSVEDGSSKVMTRSKNDPEADVDDSGAAEGELEDMETDQMGEEEEVDMDLTVNGDDSQTPKGSKKECPVDGCSTKFSSYEDLVQHTRSHPKPMLCRDCKKPFYFASDLRRHYRVHSGEKPHACTTCDKSFSRADELKMHQRCHSGEKPFACSHCSHRFSQSRSLKGHLLTHTGERPHKCTVCDACFTQKHHLKQHMSIHTRTRRKYTSSSEDKEEQKDVNLTVEDDDSKKDPEAAEDCSGAAEGELEDKEIDQMEEEDEEDVDFMANTADCQTPDDSEKECPVDGCPQKLLSKEDLEQHMRSHPKPRLCRDCKMPFDYASHHRRHYWIHSGEKPFACTTCKKTFSQSSHLQDHIRSHTGERPFECDLCDHKFTLSSTLLVHRRRHTGEKPYAYTTCTHRCVTSSDLAKHLRTHTGEKPFACTINGCDFKTANASHLSRHMKSRHK